MQIDVSYEGEENVDRDSKNIFEEVQWWFRSRQIRIEKKIFT